MCFRSRGGPDKRWNLTVVWHFYHSVIHSGQIGSGSFNPIEWWDAAWIQDRVLGKLAIAE